METNIIMSSSCCTLPPRGFSNYRIVISIVLGTIPDN